MLNTTWAGKRTHVDKIVRKYLVYRRCRYSTINTYFTMYGNSVVKVRNGSQMILNMVMFWYFDTALGSDAAGSTCATATTLPITVISFETQTFLEPSVIDFFRRGVQITWYRVTLTLTLPTPAIKSRSCSTKPFFPWNINLNLGSPMLQCCVREYNLINSQINYYGGILINGV